MTSPPATDGSRHYRFAGVELDVANYRLKVDGRARDCSRKAFEFLLILCRAGDRLISRDELIGELWPGGQVISDEALTQVIFRARVVIGDYGSLIVTQRGLGLRLDAAVSRSSETPAVPEVVESLAEVGVRADMSDAGEDRSIFNAAVETSTAPDEASTTSSSPAKVRHRRWLMPAAVTVLLATVVFSLSRLAGLPSTVAVADGVVDQGYGLLTSDLHASLADTPNLIQDALKHESLGEKLRAQDLLQAVHKSDSATPVPALFLALWAVGSDRNDEADTWIAQARERSKEIGEPYVPLLLAYAQSEIDGDPERIVSAAGALLDLRPKAWRMRLARGHLMEFMGMRAAALHEFQQIEIPSLAHNKLAMALADRASLGDLIGAQAVLNRQPATEYPLSHAYVSGRLAWTAGDYVASRAHFLKSAESAYEYARIDLHVWSLKCAAVLDALLDKDDEAIDLIIQVRKVTGGRNIDDDIDLSLFAAELHADAGDTAASEKELDRALADAAPSTNALMPIVARFATWRLRPGRPADEPEYLDADAKALWLGLRALAARDTGAARTALLSARQLGINKSRLADEARWLELQLGLPVSEQSILDPPFPPLSRVVLRRHIRRALASQGISSGPARP